ncbi:MAG: serine hydrolase [Trueperaceae bacterium]|nr:serine hydrolase [Trueperaceae bacterium]
MATISLERSTPEAQGISSEALLAFLAGAEAKGLELHSLMLLRHGKVLAEGWWSPYGPDKIHLLYSLSKSFTSSAIGLAVDEGLLKLDDKVISFFPDKLPEKLNPHLEAMTVHHLLSMGTGHRTDTTDYILSQTPNDPVKGFLSLLPEEAPGSIFCYNSGATFMLSAILQKLTGEKLVDYLEPRLFKPLGINKKYWLETPNGITQGFSGLHVVTESIAKFGQLYLQDGIWEGKRLLPKGWVKLASQKHIENKGTSENIDWQQGYGYQFWRCQHDTYRGDGAFGQYCVIMPKHDAVLAITSAVINMQDVLDLAWEHLLPAFETGELEPNINAQASLKDKLSRAKLEPVIGQASSPISQTVSGKTYLVDEYQDEKGRGTLPQMSAFRFDFNQSDWQLELQTPEGLAQLSGGYSEDKPGSSSYSQMRGSLTHHGESRVSVSGAWTKDEVFQLCLRFIETPHSLTMSFHFEGTKAKIERRWNVSFGPLELSTLSAQQH